MTEPPVLRVTDDPELNAELFAKQEELGQIGLDAYVASLGLTPPGHVPGDPLPGVYATWLPGMDYDDVGVMVWATEEDEEHDDGED